MIITIDGPSGVGKGTLAKKLADHFGYAFLDTGLLFRAAAFLLKDIKSLDSACAEKIIMAMDPASLPLQELRSEKVGSWASHLATISFIRKILLNFQREYVIKHPKGIILDGRDCGVEVIPWADKKIFLTASLEERAKRRYEDLKQRGIESAFSQVLEDITKRDARDSQRKESPLKPAVDAFVLDTSDLSAEAVLKKALFFIKS